MRKTEKIFDFLKKILFKASKTCYTSIRRDVYNMNNVIDISKYIIKYCMKKKYNITNLRLQKVLYYVQGYFYRSYDQMAFSQEIVAWTYGPVVPESYYNFCSFGRDELCLQENEDYDFSMISQEEKTRINQIVDKCNTFSVTELVDKTHSEEPWKTTAKKQTIDKKKIALFFGSNDPLNLGN